MNKKKMIYSIVFGLSVTIILYIVLESYLFLYFSYYIYTSISLIFGFGFYYFSDKIKNLLKESTKSENVSDTSLSHKYSVLLKYKVLVYILMVIDTIYSFKTLFGGGLDDKVISYVVIAYIISMFSLYCLILMIHFLFDLDKKTDNNV